MMRSTFLQQLISSATLLLFIIPQVRAQQSITQTSGGCADGHSGPNCVTRYTFTGGPGWVGHRLDYPVEMFCSPSCRGGTNEPKVCSLIMAFHGIYSNPNDQRWLMLGSPTDPNHETFMENEAYGGPFCISFHKAKDVAWDYACGGDDEAHLEAFILHALDNFPIDPEAVNLHGFSSGAIQINHMMNTRCSIERLISAAAPYGAGAILNPPTTKAAYLITHGTHDDVVPYQRAWNDSSGSDIPSCACQEFFAGPSRCTGQPYYMLETEILAGSIAKMRGYTGDIFGAIPAPTSTLDLITEDTPRCNSIVNSCISFLESPNPWNAGFSCDDVGVMETDVLEFPVSSESNAGPVTLWRINLNNHDYPNKRRDSYGAAEFFMQLRKFFNDNRGRRRYPGTRSISEVGTGYACVNPNWADFGKPPLLYRPAFHNELSEDECKERCLNEMRCKEAFFINYNSGYACMLHYDETPCLATSPIFWSPRAVHWEATTTIVPTAAPNSNGLPTNSPVSSTPQPSNSPEESLCSAGEVLKADFEVSYTCLVNGESIGDYLDGTTTSQTCANSGGEWIPYTCLVAEDYWKALPDNDDKDYLKTVWWQPRCCRDEGPTPAPVEESLCYTGETLKADFEVSYSCLVNGESIGDYLDGTTTSQTCANSGGEWIQYTCLTAEDYWKALPDDDVKDHLKTVWWQPRCCRDEGPTLPPATDCPTHCAVPECIWLGTDGPGWDSSWDRDEDGTPTRNGFCTNYCKQLPEPHTHISLCGDGDWHKTGTDCRGCSSIASSPLLAEEERQPSTGLCARMEAMSGHALWGIGIEQCSNGPEPSSDTVCTVRQSMNGDDVVNPGRTCASFCSHFGLDCLNGYDDGENRCLYGGSGIGCDSILGDFSDGGPTPDHICVCAEASTMSPTKLPTKAPTVSPTKLPTKAPTVSPTKLPTKSPTVTETASPTKLPTTTPTASPTAQATLAGFQGVLRPGEHISSPNGKIQLKFTRNGNLLLRDTTSSTLLWSSKTRGISPKAARMQKDGNFVVRDMDKNAAFSTKTNGNPGARLFVQDDGNMLIKDANGLPIWDRIQGKKGGFQGIMRPGEYISSPNGQIQLKFQQDGDLVLFDTSSSSLLWSTNTAGITPWAVGMQRDGNLVVYDTDRKPHFASGTSGNKGALLFVEDDGSLVIKDSSGTPIWDRIDGKK